MRKAMLGALLLCFGTAGAAAADPILLTSGGITVYNDGSSTIFGGTGMGFSAFGSGFGSGFDAGFNVGDTVNLSSRISFFPTFGTPGEATVGGVTELGYLTGTLQVSATPLVVGNVTSPPFGTQAFTTPFSLSGSVELLAQPGGQSLLTQQVTATGTAEFEAKNLGPGAPVQFLMDPAGSVSYEFGPSAPPVTPEPSTLLLLGAGVGVVGLWQSRRLRRAH